MNKHGKATYEAYAKSTIDVVPVAWDSLSPEEQAAWHAAGKAAIEEFWGPETCPPTARAPEGYPRMPS